LPRFSERLRRDSVPCVVLEMQPMLPYCLEEGDMADAACELDQLPFVSMRDVENFSLYESCNKPIQKRETNQPQTSLMNALHPLGLGES